MLLKVSAGTTFFIFFNVLQDNCVLANHIHKSVIHYVQWAFEAIDNPRVALELLSIKRTEDREHASVCE